MYADKQQFNQMGPLGHGATGYIQAAVEASGMRQPEVVAEVDRLQRAIEGLAITAETLTNRLSPVRNQVGNCAKEGQTSPPEPVLCGMASSLRAERKRVEEIQGVMQRALNELEI